MTADFCCSCEAGAYGIVVAKEHWGNFHLPPPGMVPYSISPIDAHNLMGSTWAPGQDRFLWTHHTYTDASNPSNNRDGIWTVDRYTGAVNYSGPPGWLGVQGSTWWSGAGGATPWCGIDVFFWVLNLAAFYPSPNVINWDTGSASYSNLPISWTISVGSPYTLGDVDADTNALLNAFAPGEVGPAMVGGAAYARAPFGSLLVPVQIGLPFDPANIASAIDPSTLYHYLDATGWQETGQYATLQGAPIAKSVVSRGSLVQPNLAAFAIWVPPDLVEPYNPLMGYFGFFYQPKWGYGSKFMSWIPLNGKYTRTVYRRSRVTGVAYPSSISQMTSTGIVQTLAPALDPLEDIWITLTPGW